MNEQIERRKNLIRSGLVKVGNPYYDMFVALCKEYEDEIKSLNMRLDALYRGRREFPPQPAGGIS